jgi:hypothetical protein
MRTNLVSCLRSSLNNFGCKSVYNFNSKDGFCPAFADTWLQLIMGQEKCHGTQAETFSGVQA